MVFISPQKQVVKVKKVTAKSRKHIIPIAIVLSILFSGTIVVLYFSSDKRSRQTIPTYIDEQGEVHLSQERKDKLAKELDEIDHSQQYALLATYPGYYP
ncbi:MAG TPA: hypothetical protein PKA00_20615 [Saprospiraceae bacterium]|nr:hypothetical protein [Saprospiraceae bacterium]HMQ85326.1 hypothetical protein [Saprospiraceae bacterium]